MLAAKRIIESKITSVTNSIDYHKKYYDEALEELKALKADMLELEADEQLLQTLKKNAVHK